MYVLSYLWHGVFLNDYIDLSYPLESYLLLSAVAYLLIGLVLTSLYQYTFIREMKYKGAMLGALLGFFIYLIAFVFGVSFNEGALHYVVADFAWQMIEQGVGGAVVGFLYSVISEMEKFARFNQ